jgi:hypothetical protein
MLVAARGTADEVLAHARQRLVALGTGERQIHVSVEVLEALLARELGTRRSEQGSDELRRSRHHGVCIRRRARLTAEASARRQ